MNAPMLLATGGHSLIGNMVGSGITAASKAQTANAIKTLAKLSRAGGKAEALKSQVHPLAGLLGDSSDPYVAGLLSGMRGLLSP